MPDTPLEWAMGAFGVAGMAVAALLLFLPERWNPIAERIDGIAPDDSDPRVGCFVIIMTWFVILFIVWGFYE